VLVRDGELRCLTMGQLASEFQTKLAVKQGCGPSPTYTEAGFVDCATPGREFGARLATSR
jgi:hypothetical protein